MKRMGRAGTSWKSHHFCNNQGEANRVYVAEAVWRDELCLGFGVGGGDAHGNSKHSWSFAGLEPSAEC